jgi:hypothetical protein
MNARSVKMIKEDYGRHKRNFTFRAAGALRRTFTRAVVAARASLRPALGGRFGELRLLALALGDSLTVEAELRLEYVPSRIGEDGAPAPASSGRPSFGPAVPVRFRRLMCGPGTASVAVLGKGRTRYQDEPPQKP